MSVSWERDVRVGRLRGRHLPGGHAWPAAQTQAGRCARPARAASLTTLQMGHPDSRPLDVTWSCLIPEGVCCGRVTSTLTQVDPPLKALGWDQCTQEEAFGSGF